MTKIFEHINYYDYLASYYRSRKQENSRFSFRSFAKKAALNSPNYLKLVIDGKRSITEVNVDKFVKGLELNRKESTYFRAMVKYTNCQDLNKKSQLLEKLLTHKYSLEYFDLKSAGADQIAFEVVRDPDYFIIYELINVKGFKKSASWINKKLKEPVESYKIHKIIRDFIRGGFIEKGADGGLKQTDTPMKFHVDEIKRLAVLQHHSGMIQRGLAVLQDESKAFKHFPSITLPVNHGDLPNIREDINQFLHQLTVKYRSVSDANAVCQLTMQLFSHTNEH